MLVADDELTELGASQLEKRRCRGPWPRVLSSLKERPCLGAHLDVAEDPVAPPACALQGELAAVD